jgi:hypothetical protein
MICSPHLTSIAGASEMQQIDSFFDKVYELLEQQRAELKEETLSSE